MSVAAGIPVLDLENTPEAALVAQVAAACSTWGFFQVRNHGVPPAVVDAFRAACRRYFALPGDVKARWRRREGNARGFFDDELTKRRRDWKQCLDLGVPGARAWALSDDDARNACLDGANQLPTEAELPGFREAVTTYFDACAALSHRLAVLMAKGIVANGDDDALIRDLEAEHTSYLRLNYYPVCDSDEDPPPLGISPHKDAGFLTVLLQDDDCHSLQVFREGEWIAHHPEPGAFTINTGDMAQIWSNGVYRAPLHRVLVNRERVRYSAPFFYNPSYAAWVRPAAPASDAVGRSDAPDKYHPVLWGYFRSVRFAGDLTDLGVEIQIEDFEKENDTPSHHLDKQKTFAEQARFDEPFSVDKFRPLLSPIDRDTGGHPR